MLFSAAGFSVAFAAEQKPDPSQTLTLPDCYKLALKRSETVAIQQEIVNEAEGRFQQYLNKIMPQTSFEASKKIEDGNSSSSGDFEFTETKFVFNQVIFSGFRELARISASRSEKGQRAYEKVRAEQLLLTDVANAFYFFLTYQEDMETLTVIRDALLERITDLKKREEVGRSRLSEVVGAQARLSRLEAELESVRSDSEVARQLLEFLIGQPVSATVDAPHNNADVDSGVDAYIGKAGNRPDVLAAKEALKAAGKMLHIAKASFSPSLNAEGNYYLDKEDASESTDWDATFKVSVPIGSAGENFGKVKEAKAKYRGAEYLVSANERKAVLDIKNAHTQYFASLRKAAALKKALEESEENYKLQKEDYRLSLVNNLTVLQALEDLQNVRREYIAAKNNVEKTYWDFKVAIGEVAL